MIEACVVLLENWMMNYCCGHGLVLCALCLVLCTCTLLLGPRQFCFASGILREAS